jgi:hypothetical protein
LEQRSLVPMLPVLVMLRLEDPHLYPRQVKCHQTRSMNAVGLQVRATAVASA